MARTNQEEIDGEWRDRSAELRRRMTDEEESMGTEFSEIMVTVSAGVGTGKIPSLSACRLNI